MNPRMKIPLAASRVRQIFASLALLSLVFCQSVAPAQQQPQQQPQQNQQQTQPNQQGQQPEDQSAPEAGGPGGDNGSIAIPKKKEAEPAPPPPPEPKVKNPPGLQNFSLHVDVPVVTVDVGVILEKTRQFVPNLKEENFRVFEDGKPQEIASFQQVKAPITAVLLVEFASTSYYFVYDMRNAAYNFAEQLRPDDYIAVMTYDMHTNILTDFTQDKRVVMNSLNQLTIPTWRETNMFDALYQTLDRLTRVDGRKYIILIGSGIDTFSKINLDKVLAKIKATPNVTIFTMSTGGFVRAMTEGRGGMGAQIRDMSYLQADNEMNTFARMTGGMHFEPRFQGELPEDFAAINESIRNQYVLSYTPASTKQDGTYRKLRVELVDAEGHP